MNYLHNEFCFHDPTCYRLPLEDDWRDRSGINRFVCQSLATGFVLTWTVLLDRFFLFYESNLDTIEKQTRKSILHFLPVVFLFSFVHHAKTAMSSPPPKVKVVSSMLPICCTSVCVYKKILVIEKKTNERTEERSSLFGGFKRPFRKKERLYLTYFHLRREKK